MNSNGHKNQNGGLIKNYSSSFKPSSNLLSDGTGNLMTSQGKEGVVANKGKGVEESSGAAVTQFVAQPKKVPSLSPRNSQIKEGGKAMVGQSRFPSGGKY